MESRYLYKAKRKDNGEWVYGYLWVGACSAYITPFNVGITYYEENKRIVACAYEIDPTTICRCTGLTDKNGKLIWENDIVKFPDCEMSTESGYGDCFINAGKVAYDTESMSYFFTDRITVDMSDIIIKEEVEVLGNIFDNPELLEESHE